MVANHSYDDTWKFGLESLNQSCGYQFFPWLSDGDNTIPCLLWVTMMSVLCIPFNLPRMLIYIILHSSILGARFERRFRGGFYKAPIIPNTVIITYECINYILALVLLSRVVEISITGLDRNPIYAVPS